MTFVALPGLARIQTGNIVLFKVDPFYLSMLHSRFILRMQQIVGFYPISGWMSLSSLPHIVDT